MPRLPRRMPLQACSAAFRVVAALALVVASTATVLAQPHAPLPDLAAENAALATSLAAATSALAASRADLERLRATGNALDDRMRGIARHAQMQVAGREYSESVRSELRALPDPRRTVAARWQREHDLEAASDANIRTESAARALSDLDAAVARHLASASLSSAELAQAEPTARGQLERQRELLGELGALQWEHLRTLKALDDVDADIARRASVAHAELTRLLFWIPSHPGPRVLGEIVPALEWMVSPSNWREAFAVLGDAGARRPVLLGAAVLLVTGLLAGRRRMRQRLARAPFEVSPGIGPTWLAIAITFALALPVPTLLATASTLLASAPASQGFALALGDALWAIANLLLALSAYAWLLDRRGVAVIHFGRDEATVTYVGSALRRFIALFVPLMFVAALNGMDHAPYANRESLARLAFCAALVVLVVFLVRMFRKTGPPMQRLAQSAPRSWLSRFHAVGSAAVIAIPLGILGLVFAGYFTAAAYFFGRLVESLFFILGAAFLYGLIARWIRLQRADLVRSRAEDAARSATTPHRERAEVLTPRLDASLGREARSVLDVLATVLLLAGLWWVWKDTLPVLSVIGDFTLWNTTINDAGAVVARPVNVSHLFLAIVVGAITVVVVRNVGALLDVMFLQRLEVQPDATYAVKVIARYVATAVGVLLVSRILGIAWSDVQWLIAALGVGLGFGLQDIVANFVAGLIVLAERPVRIGDVVTIGDITGTVVRIRARTTAVVDGDNREVIIPNKAFITERVVNWTLSNQTTRLRLPFAVAYGSDVTLVHRVVLETLRRNDDVLQEPPPSVRLASLGEGSFKFEIGVYVSSVAARGQLGHEINVAVERALREHGIRFPGPPRDDGALPAGTPARA